MQAALDNKQVHERGKVSAILDLIFSQPYLYAFFSVIALKPRALCDVDALLASVLGVERFPLFYTTTYLIVALVLIGYVLRWALKDIRRVNPTLISILGMFLYLDGITFVFDGASGYHIDWHAGFALMMMIDMGLQRERDSLLRGLTGALECWVYLNVICFVVFPNSLLPAGRHPEWLLGNHVFYYRIVFPALTLAFVRYFVLGKTYLLRTVIMALAAGVTIAYQRGGTALIGIAVLLLLTFWCNRRALPRYISPVLFTVLAAMILIGIQFFDLLNLFSTLITEVLHKSMTLSNRTVLWDKIMDIIFKNPLTGVGYFPVAYMKEIMGGAYSHTHNQLLELMLHGGAIAVGMYLAAIYFATKEALLYRRSLAVKAVTLLVCTLAIMGVAEIFHNDPIYYALFIFLSRADCLTEGVKQQPRISLIKRIKRDLRIKKATV
ncbi:MAG: O-antigen ligase family protein [Clostridia bacterium]|nr:O-antigen ligase family protein [Clostridia bacterium]